MGGQAQLVASGCPHLPPCCSGLSGGGRPFFRDGPTLPVTALPSSLPRSLLRGRAARPPDGTNHRPSEGAGVSPRGSQTQSHAPASQGRAAKVGWWPWWLVVISQEVPQSATQACWRKPQEEAGWLLPTWIQNLIPPMESTQYSPPAHSQREGTAHEASLAGLLGSKRGQSCVPASLPP